MSEAGLPTESEAVERFFKASELSADAATAEFPLHRVVPITMFIDADPDRVYEAERFVAETVSRVLEAEDFEQVFLYGPHTASSFGIGFWRSKDPHDGPSFSAKCKRITAELGSKLKEALPDLGEGGEIIILVGSVVLHVAGETAIAAVLPATIPIAVIHAIIVVHDGATAAVVAHKMFKRHRRKK